MILNTLKEVKERGIRNILSEEMEKIKELGVAGYLKAKAEEFKETASNTVMGAQRKLIGEVKPKESTYSTTSVTFMENESPTFIEPSERVEVSGNVNEGYNRERSGM